MHLTFHCGRFPSRKLLLIMRLTIILLLVATFQVSARTYSQKVTITGKDLSLERVFELIKQQTGYAFVADQRVIAKAPSVTLQVKDASLEEVLNKCLRNLPLSYSISDKIIVIAHKQTSDANAAFNTYFTPPPVAQGITGVVLDESGQPVEAAAVRIKELNKGAQTNKEGRFTFDAIASGSYTLLISSVGFDPKELRVQVGNSIASVQVTLQASVNKLDETVVRGYYETSRRLNTGNVSTVKSDDIARQPVGDPLAALQGRVAGLIISSSNGLPASSFNVTIRGRSSLGSLNTPLYIVDGVPYSSESLDQFSSANGVQSPFSTINPADIERIDVLKDADATSIYGSRGANGVILITTKKGKVGATRFDFNGYTGGSRVVNQLDMLNTQQYLQMRKEAFANDNAPITPEKAPDLLTWNANDYTNWQDYMIGHTSRVSNVHGSVSGGNEQTRFLLSATYRHETTVQRDDDGYKRGAVHLNVEHLSSNKKFNVTASVDYAGDKNNSLATNLTQFYDLAPNYPLYNPDGSLYWFSNTIENPAAYLERKSKSRNTNLIASSSLRYAILPNLNLKTRIGYNQSTMNQIQLYPDRVFNPANNTGNMSYFGNTSQRSYVIEPQIDYDRKVGNGKLQLLAGASWQERVKEGSFLVGHDFASEALMESIFSATSVDTKPVPYIFYRYTSVFGRANYNLDDKYILNATFRRDGSTRFAKEKRFGNFGSVGAAWVFSNESFIRPGILSFGKLRMSYGSSGNDEIPDYGYLDSWGGSSFPYDGISGISPERIPSNLYSWEHNTKLEAGVELGFLKDRIFLAASYYRNISNNQLIEYALSPQAGREGVAANFPATVLNTGLELELNTTNVQRKDFTWKSSLNFTLPTNKLTKFTDIEKSSYNNTFVVGQSLTIVKGYQFTGVDPATGIPQFLDLTGDGKATENDDYVVIGKTMPSWYGGLQNAITYKNFQLDFLFQFVKQEGPGVNYGYLSYSYGVLSNKDISALDRWSKASDQTSVPRASTTSGNAAYDAYTNNYRLSSAVWENASYVRLKNLSLKYDLSSYVQRWKLKSLSVYLLAQNLLTFTNYKGFDPETQGTSLPPLKTITAGLQFTF